MTSKEAVMPPEVNIPTEDCEEQLNTDRPQTKESHVATDTPTITGTGATDVTTEDNGDDHTDSESQPDNSTSKTVSRELKSILELSKEAKLDTNIVHKRKSIEPSKVAESDGGRDTPTKKALAKSKLKAGEEGSEVMEEYFISGKLWKKRKSVVDVAMGAMSEEKRAKWENKVDLSFLKKNKDPFCWRCHKNTTNPVHAYSSVGLSCETCPRSYHFRCIKNSPNSYWQCPECIATIKAENLKTRSPSLKSMDLEHLCTLLKFALKRMIQIADSAPFLHPVNETEFPDYKTYIVNPMDLTKLEKNIQANLFGSTNAFEAEARWILHNSIIYNSYQSKLTSTAKAILKVCKQEMSEVENCSSCYLNANTKENWFVEVCPKPHLLLWAKLKGFPYWPAKAMCTNSTGMVDVRFFGAHDRAWVSYKDCYLYSHKNPNSNQMKKNDINECIKEVEIYIDNLKKKYGTFRYASYKTPFDPDQESLRVYLPKYIPTEDPKKSVRMRRSLSKSSLSNSTKSQGDSPESSMKEIANMEMEFSDEEASPDLDFPDSNVECNGATDSELSVSNVSKSAEPKKEEVESEDKSLTQNKCTDETPKKAEGVMAKIKISHKLFKKFNSTAEDAALDEKENKENKLGEQVLKEKELPLPPLVPFSKPKQKRPSKYEENDLLEVLYSERIDGSILDTLNEKDDDDELALHIVESGEPQIDEEKNPSKMSNSKKGSDVESDNQFHKEKFTIENETENLLSQEKTDSETEAEINEILDEITSVQKSDTELEIIKCYQKDVFEESSTVEISKILRGTSKDKPETVSNGEQSKKRKASCESTGHSKKIATDPPELFPIENLPPDPLELSKEVGEIELVQIKSESLSDDESPKNEEAKESAYMLAKQKLLEALNISEKLADEPPKPKVNEMRTRSKKTYLKPKILNTGYKEKKCDTSKDSGKKFDSSGKKHDKDKEFTRGKKYEKDKEFIAGKKYDKELKKYEKEYTSVKKYDKDLAASKKPRKDSLLGKTYDKDSTPGKKLDSQRVVKDTKKYSLKTVSVQTSKQRARKSFPNTKFTNEENDTLSIPRECSVNLASNNLIVTNSPTTTDVPHTVQAKPVLGTTTTTVITTPSVITQATQAQNVVLMPQSIVLPPNQTVSYTGSDRNSTFLTMVPQSNASFANIFLPQTQSFITSGNINFTPITVGAQVGTEMVTAEASEGSMEVGQSPDPNEPLNPDGFNILNGILSDNVPRMMKNVMYKPPPVLKPRPAGPLSTVFDGGVPSAAGPMTAQVNSIAHRLSDYFRGMLIETLNDVAGKTDTVEAVIANLRLENEALKYKHNEEILEIKKNVNSILQDIQKSIIEEKEKVVLETKALCEVEAIKRIEEAKSKQWCANCLKEAQFYCCWNTSYCDYPCQTKHWPMHMTKCTQNVKTGNSQAANLIPNKGCQPLVLRPTAPLKGFSGKTILGKTTKLFVNKTGSKLPFNIVRTSAPNITLVESSPGNFELLGNGQLTTESCTTLNKIISHPTLINKMKTGNIITVSSAGPTAQTSMPVIFQQSKSPPPPNKISGVNGDVQNEK